MASSTKAAQADHVQHAVRRVEKHAKLMNSAADAENLKEALKHALAMLHELRTKHLSPKPYYELYMTVFSHLGFLESYFHRSVASEKRSARELYEMVQHAGNVLPRLYLMVTAGPVVIRSRRMSAAKVLKDMTQMAKGVQHPTRALFLRYYLLQKTSTLLPEEGSPYHGEGGTVSDAVSFVLENTVEIIRLWVRMQAAAEGKTRKRRSRERREIRQVVGTAIDKTASIEGVTEEQYAEAILPSLLTELRISGDALAQEFLFDCVLQAFPVAFHLATLEQLVAAAASVVDGVSVRDLITGLMRRISTEAGSTAAADAFGALLEATKAAVAERRERIGAAAVADIFGALVGFTAATFPGDAERVNTVLTTCADCVFEGREANEAGQNAVAGLLCAVWQPRAGDAPAAAAASASASSSAPTPGSAAAAAGSASLRDRSGADAAAGLDAKQAALLPGSGALLACLGPSHRRRVAASLADALATCGSEIATEEECEAILGTLAPLLRDDAGDTGAGAGGPGDAVSAEAFADEQRSVARLVHCIGRGAASAADEYSILCAARRTFGRGQARRIVHTLPPVVVRLLEVRARLEAEAAAGEEPRAPASGGKPVTVKAVLRTAHETCAALNTVQPLSALRLFLLCGSATSASRPCYDFLSQAILLHEDVPESALQRSSLLHTVGALRACGPAGMGHEGYTTLATRCTKFAAKLLRKQHAVECVLACAALFWVPAPEGGPEEAAFERPEQVLTCLGKAAAIADDAIPRDPSLFVQVFDSYVYFFGRKCPSVGAKELRDAATAAREGVSDAMGDQATEAKAQLDAVVDHVNFVREQAASDPSLAHWEGVTV